MFNVIFILSLTSLLILLFRWAFRHLPGEEWQILGCLPTAKRQDGGWNALNLTYYGLFNALATTLAVALFFTLTGSLRLPLIGTITIIITMIGICTPAARVLAFAVEGKRHTLTVGGAFFCGLFVAPAAIMLVNATMGKQMGFDVPMLSILAIISISYSLGEGIGRLACISFGCCYGKPLSACHPLLKRIFARRHFLFSGKNQEDRLCP